MKYNNHFNTRVTPQVQAIPGSGQVANLGGGFSWKVTDAQQLERFLILGTEGGTYYVTEQKLTVENATSVVNCLAADARTTIDKIVEVSVTGKAAKNDPAIFALAIAAGSADPACRAYALSKLSQVCRTATHLFTFVEFVEGFRGWGKGLRKAVAKWYTEKDPGKLAYQIVKYQQRNGWSHRDLLRLAHASPPSELHQAVMRYAVKGTERTVDYPADQVPSELRLIWAFEQAKKSRDVKEVVDLIDQYGLTHEMVPNDLKKSPEIWAALLVNMPITATIRNLGRMSSIGLLKPFSAASKLVEARLLNPEVLRNGRVHPLQILSAKMTYQQGHGVKGNLTWTTDARLTQALEDSFYLSFETVEPSGKNFLLGIDISGSMTWVQAGGLPGFTPNMTSAVMAMATARVEQNYHIMGFAHTFRDLGITARDTLESAMQKTHSGSFGYTDCSLPMVWALANNLLVDTFVVYTDSETNSRTAIHPAQALDQYRQKMGRNAKLIVCAMTSSSHTIARSGDPNMLDVVGFSTDTPKLISMF